MSAAAATDYIQFIKALLPIAIVGWWLLTRPRLKIRGRRLTWGWGTRLIPFSQAAQKLDEDEQCDITAALLTYQTPWQSKPAYQPYFTIAEKPSALEEPVYETGILPFWKRELRAFSDASQRLGVAPRRDTPSYCPKHLRFKNGNFCTVPTPTAENPHAYCNAPLQPWKPRPLRKRLFRWYERPPSSIRALLPALLVLWACQAAPPPPVLDGTSPESFERSRYDTLQ